MFVFQCVCVCVFLYLLCVCVPVYLYVCVYTRTHPHKHRHIHTYLRLHSYTLAHTHTHSHTHMYTNTCMQTHTPTHTQHTCVHMHTRTYPNVPSLSPFLPPCSSLSFSRRDTIQTQMMVHENAASVERELTDEDMQDIMRSIIEGQDLSVAAQARMNAGGAEAGNFINLKLPDGTTRCQGMVGVHTQCPRGLDCKEHRLLNERFLNGYQMLKKGQKNTRVSAGDYRERDLEVGRMKQRLKSLAHNKYGVPFRVFGVITWDNWLRKRVGQIVRSHLFDRIILSGILLNCAVLAIERPRRDSLEQEITYLIHLALTIIFWLEMLLKCIWYGPSLYSANAFNRVDILVNLISGVELLVRLLVLTANSSALESFRVLRIFRGLRALRPLRSVFIFAVLCQESNYTHILHTCACVCVCVCACVCLSLSVSRCVFVCALSVSMSASVSVSVYVSVSV